MRLIALLVLVVTLAACNVIQPPAPTKPDKPVVIDICNTTVCNLCPVSHPGRGVYESVFGIRLERPAGREVTQFQKDFQRPPYGPNGRWGSTYTPGIVCKVVAGNAAWVIKTGD